MRKQLATIAIAALLVLAGCSGGGSAGTTTAPDASTDAGTTAAETGETTMAADTTDGSTGDTTAEATADTDTDTDGTPSSSLDMNTDPPSNLDPASSMSDMPDGVEEGEPANVTALLANNNDQVYSDGYVLDATFLNSTTDEENGFTIRNESGASGAINVSSDFSVPRGTARIDSYVTENVISYRTRAMAQGRTKSVVTYSTGDGSAGFLIGFLLAGYELQDDSYLAGADWEPVGVDTSGSEDLLVLNATALNESRYDSSGFFFSSPAGENESLQDVNGVMYVDESGVIQQANVSYTLEHDDGSTYTQGLAFTYETGGVTVPEPAWTDEVPHVEASINDDKTIMTLEHTGGKAIPSGTTMEVKNPNFMASDANVTIDQEVTQGEKMYVYLNGSGMDATPKLSVGSKPSLSADAEEFGFNVEVSGTVNNDTFAAAPPDEDE